MLLQTREAGISCDEVLHYDHSLAVYNYFKSHGSDQSALNTPLTHLKYYGQSYDNVVTVLIKWLGIDDVYGFRHIMSALAGWLTVFITALFAIWLSGYRTGILVMLLFAVSPTFMGHAQNNLKDIPFALSYIAGIFFILKFLTPERKQSLAIIPAAILSIGFSISIRSGGLLLICYLFLFWMLSVIFNRLKQDYIDYQEESKKLLLLTFISFAAFFLGILLWPFALQDPFRNVFESYTVMAHFPSTFRQIFEGTTEWSDFMPWYYLPKSMAITIPLVVTAGLLIFLIFIRRILRTEKSLLFIFVLFATIFPMVFVIIKRSNLYSSWRQFLFLYPLIILISAEGYSRLFDFIKKDLLKWTLFAVILLIAYHPVKFMFKNPSFYYLYYNQLAGGLKGAYGNYETDYYYIGQTEASGWLIKYLEEKKVSSAIVGATFSVAWQFRDHPDVKTLYMRNEEMSMYDWDYAIITNRYIPVSKLKNHEWPPEGTIHTIYADNIPVCAVIERKNKSDYQGFKALSEGRNPEAINYFKEALKTNNRDEMIFYNFARALYNVGNYQRADSVLKAGLEINPRFEPILMYLGNIAAFNKQPELALEYYRKVIKANRKYFDAYVKSAGLVAMNDLKGARSLLKECLGLNPEYKPAITSLADTYRKTDPEIARRYDEIAEKIK